jgi:putative peptidoglycan lipid II flippase
MNIVVDIVVSIALYKPLGIAGLIIGTIVANIVMTALQFHRLRTGLNGRLEGGQTTMITVRILVGTVIMAAIARGIWVLLDDLLGRSLAAQIFSVGIACAVAGAVYAKLVLTMRVPEARQIQGLIMARLRSS